MSSTIGVSANIEGAHTRELLDGVRDAIAWTGIDCETIWAEDGRDPGIARDAARRLIAAGVPLVVGHLSAAASVAAAQVYAAHDVALVAPATSHPDLNPRDWPGILRVCGTDTQTARVMLAAAPPRDRHAILCQDQIFGRSLAACLQQELARAGAGPVDLWVHGEEDALPPALDGLTHVFVTGVHEYCAVIVRELRRWRPSLDITLGDDCLTPNFLRLADGAAEGARIVCPVVPEIDDASAGYRPAATIGTSIALQALAAHPEARGARLGRIMRARVWNTPFGAFGFDGRGNVTGLETRVFRVVGKEFRPDRAPPA